MRQIVGAVTCALALMVNLGNVFAGPFDDGIAAYSRGDYVAAIRLLRPSGKQGNPVAQYTLGLMYGRGQGVKQNHDEALRWLLLSGKQGYSFAQHRLGEIYANGTGVAQNRIIAQMWFNLAAQGAEYTEGAQSFYTQHLNSAQIAQAQEMARQCKQSNYKQCGDSEIIQTRTEVTSVSMQRAGGVYVVPVLINNAITLDFVIDSGATDVRIPADVVMTLVRSGTVRESDFLGERTYILADGSKVPSPTFRIRSLKVGNKVLENVTGSIASVQGPLLLGQSFLSRFRSWRMDNTKHALILDE